MMVDARVQSSRTAVDAPQSTQEQEQGPPAARVGLYTHTVLVPVLVLALLQLASSSS